MYDIVLLFGGASAFSVLVIVGFLTVVYWAFPRSLIFRVWGAKKLNAGNGVSNGNGVSMAQQAQGKFGFRKVQLIKTEPVGRGASGSVYKAMCDELLCAGKILHPTLFQPNDPGAMNTFRRFQQECSFLREIRHPNIVQYLGLHQDPETQLPVLLMELMDENLTRFLERSQESLLYHTQVNICHDIALALAYLHSNDIMHRDLSSNNVFVIDAGNRAKVTDFGAAKLFNVNCITLTPLTMCPGTQPYMPPEALDDPPVYTKKLDSFSFGVLDIQIITRQFPDPGPRTKKVSDPRSPTGRMEKPVLETERRKSHLDLIDSTHPLRPILINCLSYDEEDRPSAQELCHCLAALKEASQYGDSVQQGSRLAQQQLQEKNTSLTWKTCKVAPCTMCRGSATVCGKVAYFIPDYDNKVRSYDTDTEEWSTLPKCPNGDFTLTVVNGLVTAVGGSPWDRWFESLTNTLLTLNQRKKWYQHFPPMPTKRKHTAVVCSGKALVVAGGKGEQNTKLTTVEVMNTDTRLWSTVSSLPHPLSKASATVCGDRVYLVGGEDQQDEPTWKVFMAELVNANAKHRLDEIRLNYDKSTKSLLTCSLSALLQSAVNHWNRITNLPHKDSTCVTLNGQLLTVGGKDSHDKDTDVIYSYKTETHSWEVISRMPTARHKCLVTVLPGNKLMVVGGCCMYQEVEDRGKYTELVTRERKENNVEIATVQ